MAEYFKKIIEFFRKLTPRQITWLAIGGVLAVATVVVFVNLIGRADYRVLYSGLNTADATSLAQQLASRNIPYQLSTDGTSISVPADQIDRTRLALASEGQLPQSGRMGFELFDKPNWAGSDFSEQVNYQRALEGELERTIQTLPEIENVRVHLVLPHESLYTDQERAAKAAVVVKLRGGGLTDADVNAITRLVAGSVDNLSPDNVTLIGADRSPEVAHGHHGGQNGLGDADELEAGLAEKVIATLAPVVGEDHVKASVTVAYDPDSGETTQEVYDPNSTVVISSQIHEEQIGGAVPQGVPGTPSNVPGPGASSAASSPATNKPNAAPGTPNTTPGTPGQSSTPFSATPFSASLTGSETESQRTEDKQMAVSKTVHHIQEPPGRIQKIAAAVLVDDAIEVKNDNGKQEESRRKRTPEEMKQIEDLAKAAIGFDAMRGDQLVVQNLPFQEVPGEKPAVPPLPERVRLITERWIWVLRYVALALLFLAIYLFVLNPVKKQLLASFQTAAEQLTAGAQPALASASGGSLPGQSALPLSDEEIERQLTTASSEVQRVVTLKRHLSDKIKRDPATASQLIRTWIREEQTTK